MNNLNNNNNNQVINNNGNKCPPASSPVKTKSFEIEKKWMKQDKKQKEIELKLGLALATAQLPISLINNPFFRDFVETAQPKFTMPFNASEIDELINSQFSRTIQSIKLQLAAAPKVSLLLDILKVPQQPYQKEIDENSEIPVIQNSKTPIIRICVSAAYYCSSSQVMEVVLLGIRSPSKTTSIEEGIKESVEQVLSEFDLNWDRISRVVASGLTEVGASESLFPKQLEPYNQKLTLSLINVFDTDELVISLKKEFYSMVYKFAEIPEAVNRFSQEVENSSSIPLGEPFFQIAEYILKNREKFLKICNLEQFQNLIPILSEEKWLQLESIINLLSLFKAHMKVVQDGQYATIDQVVPSLMQLKVCLQRDFKVLGQLPEKLLKDLYTRAQYILDISTENFDGSFIQATALNPQLAMLLDDAQISYAKNAIEKLLEDRMKQAEEFANKKIKNSGGVDALLAAVVERKTSIAPCNPTSPANSPASSTTSEVSSTPSTATTLYPDLLQAANQRRKVLHDRSQSGKSLFAEAIVQSYFDDLLKVVYSDKNLTSLLYINSRKHLHQMDRPLLRTLPACLHYSTGKCPPPRPFNSATSPWNFSQSHRVLYPWNGSLTLKEFLKVPSPLWSHNF